jgi:acyl-CoA synthetase (NDP forming)
MQSLTRLLRPRTIAVFGGKVAAETIRQNDRLGFTGEIWPVHPEKSQIEGRRAYRSIAELPGAPDAAFVAVNRFATLDVVEALRDRGAGGIVSYASGFSEVGPEGAALQADLVRRAGSMPVLGPNCYGFLNYLDGVALWPDQHGGGPVARGVAIVTQSGNIGLNLTMQKRGLPIAYLITLGNQAVCGLSDAIEALTEDPRVTAIGLHIEGVDDPVAFARAVGIARSKNLPVVALRAGRSEASAALAVSHTASLAGSSAAADAYFAKIRLACVNSVPALLETLKILHMVGPLESRDIASMSCSGGEAALIADVAARRNLRFRALEPEPKAKVQATFPDLVTVSNPLDYHTFTWGNEPALTMSFAAMLEAKFGMTMLILDFPRGDRCADDDWRVSARAMIAAARLTGRPAAVVSSLPELLPESHVAELVAGGVVPLLGLEEALDACETAAQIGAWAGDPAAEIPAPVSRRAGQPHLLTEWQGKQALKAFGVGVPEGRLVDDAAAAVEAAEVLGYPVALKAVGTGIAHKTEMGAVKLNLRDADSVATTATALRAMGDAVLVEQMVAGTVAELIVGVNRDPKFGPYLLVGSGGILVELVGDARLMLMPASRDEIRAAIRSLKVGVLIAGFRGQPAGDLEAAVESVLGIQKWALAHLDRLTELDVNPLMVSPSGATAADVLINLVGEF